jgi:YidC/Oxa1 family membrane protein insertase
MMYIVPFFSLTGLYWQYGLVLYWVTTNLWTLGQQYFMFRNWTTEPVGADSAVAGATTGGSARATQSSVRPQRQGSGAAKAAGAAGAAKAASGGSRTGTASGRTASGSSASGSSGSGSARPKDGTTSASSRTSNGSGGARTGTTSRPATAAPRPATGQNGTEKRGLFGLGRAKPEPEPQDDVPAAKVVRQQPVRQAKSKRSGNKR